MKKAIVGVVLVGLAIVLIVVGYTKRHEKENIQNTVSNTAGVTVVASDLHVPWSLVFLPDGTLVATERDGNLRIIGDQSSSIPVPTVAEVGEGGLLGVALHPDFVSNNYMYLYFTYHVGTETKNKVVRYVFDSGNLTEDKVIIDNIPGGTNRNGGRIAFGPDDMLYITTGDSGEEDLAQDTDSLAGKILRLTEEGAVPADNPFGNAVYSYGHRNPQGLAWDDEGRLWETEHGRSGAQSGYDEVNLIQKGANYGWPEIQGDETREGMQTPVVHSGGSTTWAPSGIAYHDGKLYFAGLRGRALYETTILSGGELGEITAHVEDVYGRLRGVTVGPDGSLYVSTSNRDGRGDPFAGDDKIIKISL